MINFKIYIDLFFNLFYDCRMERKKTKPLTWTDIRREANIRSYEGWQWLHGFGTRKGLTIEQLEGIEDECNIGIAILERIKAKAVKEREGNNE